MSPNQHPETKIRPKWAGFWYTIDSMKINPKSFSSLIKIATYLIIFYILFLLGRTLWTNYNLRSSIEKLNQQIVILNQEKKNLENLNLYYQSDSFKELEARKKLGLKAPGEKVMILKVTSSPGSFPQEVEKEKEETAPKTNETPSPNWLLWWEFFTK